MNTQFNETLLAIFHISLRTADKVNSKNPNYFDNPGTILMPTEDLDTAQKYVTVSYLNRTLSVMGRLDRKKDITYASDEQFPIIEAERGFGIMDYEGERTMFYQKPEKMMIKDLIDSKFESAALSIFNTSLYQWRQTGKLLSDKSMSVVHSESHKNLEDAEKVAGAIEDVLFHIARFHGSDINPKIEVYPSEDNTSYKLHVNKSDIEILRMHEKLPGISINKN